MTTNAVIIWVNGANYAQQPRWKIFWRDVSYRLRSTE